MRKQVKRICIFAIILPLVFAAPKSLYAAMEPDVHAAAHVLIEMENGRVLSEYQAHSPMFPAATTMLLTAILAYEHIGMDEIIVAGNEVRVLPHGSASNHHEPGEAILGINLLRGMLIGRGNDTANVVVIEVVRRTSGDPNVSFANAQLTFRGLMNQRAAELGATNTRFDNPHGFHHDNHFTTAYDMAQIARHALSIPTIAQVVGQASFSGQMWGGDGADVPDGALMLSRTWRSLNELLHEGSEHYYPYAIGVRAGWTSQAGDSLVSAAVRDGITLIAVTFNSPEIAMETGDGGYAYAPTRWQDNINLFEYGFANYAHRVFLQENTTIGQLPIYDPRIDDPGTLEFFSTQQGTLFLSNAEMGRLQREVHFTPELITSMEDEYGNDLGYGFIAPIYENDVLGTVSYYLDGQVIFSTAIYAARYVPVRTTVSDIEIRMERIHEIFFTAAAIPYWIAALSVITLATVLIVLALRARKRKKNNYKYNWKY